MNSALFLRQNSAQAGRRPHSEKPIKPVILAHFPTFKYKLVAKKSSRNIQSKTKTVHWGAYSVNRDSLNQLLKNLMKTCSLPLPITSPHLSAGTAYVTSCSPPGPPMLQSPRPRRPTTPPNPSRSCRKGTRRTKVNNRRNFDKNYLLETSKKKSVISSLNFSNLEFFIWCIFYCGTLQLFLFLKTL